MFILSEVIKIISRAKLHFIVNLISISISVFLFTLSFLIFYSSDAIDKYLQDNLSLSIFLKENLIDERIDEISEIIKSKNYTSKIEYISKERAYEIFLEETGEDFRKILDVNPLPASFNLFIKSEFVNKDSLTTIISDLSKVEGVAEVVSKMDFFERIFSLTARAKNYILLITLLMILISIYLVFSTNKLIINSNSEKYETMKLVGAKLSTIKMPIVLNNFLIGLIAGTISFALFYLIINFLQLNLQSILSYLGLDLKILILVVFIAGPVFGVIISLISLSNITLKVKT